ncbi:MAG: tRNA pseudouridine(38-40) synthase TruA [Thermoplasmata archaeon]|nr:MAG: tRNA pseudouridine(38-40) synthase TruA [Thermoplasmata archaeon]
MMEVRRHVVKFAFDGHLFKGYARQPDGGTVEDELIEALVRSDLIAGPKEASFASASRVDRGVSAIAAAAAFDTEADTERVLRSLNANTVSLVAHSIATVERGFDSRRRASSRWYRYHFGPGDEERGLDVPSMRRAAGAFEGEHDMSAFARLDGREPVRRVLQVSVERRSGALVMDVRGESFLWNQVRRMASAIRAVGAGELTVEDVERALAGGGGGPFPPLPPMGLFLMDVTYDGLTFERCDHLPSGTLHRLREDYHQEQCSVRFHEYLMNQVRF